MKNTIQFNCSKHGVQKFSAFNGHAHLVLKCGCTWYAGSDELVFDRTLPYREMWWEQTLAERIKYGNCAMEKCKRKVVERWEGDYWCAKDLRRVQTIREANSGHSQA